MFCRRVMIFLKNLLHGSQKLHDFVLEADDVCPFWSEIFGHHVLLSFILPNYAGLHGYTKCVSEWLFLRAVLDSIFDKYRRPSLSTSNVVNVNLKSCDITVPKMTISIMTSINYYQLRASFVNPHRNTSPGVNAFLTGSSIQKEGIVNNDRGAKFLCRESCILT